MAEFLTDIETLRARARQNIEQGPITAAQTGSVPSSRLTREGDVRRTAQVCTKNAKTVQTSTR